MHHFPSVFESISDLSEQQILGLMALASKFKSFSSDWQGLPIPFLKRPLIATSFLENSTRTKLSFAVAVEKLGATHIDFNADTSSLKKGESLKETLKTLRYQGIDLCIIRTSVSHELAQFKDDPPIKIINGGDGTNQHPTQALLDAFTMQEVGFDLNGKTVAIIGDLIHSRVGHSLIDLLPILGANIILCGPEACLPDTSHLDHVTSTTNVDEAIDKADLLYLLRIQKERHGQGVSTHFERYDEHFGIDLTRLKKHNKKVPIFHPGPANVGVEIGQDVMESPLYFGYSQVVHSVYMRMAIMQAVLQNSDKRIGIQVESQHISQL